MGLDFAEYLNLASERLGARALAANDDFFAPKENLVKAAPPVFLEHVYTERGKWMDGWETRRRRSPGYDWCVLGLGLRGAIRGLDVDTRFFVGNYPESCSLDALDAPSGTPLEGLLASPGWVELLPKSSLRGDGSNLFGVSDDRAWTHVRLNIHPDGGVARLRAYGEAVRDFSALAADAPVDLAAAENGGRALAASDMTFSSRHNLLLPGRSWNMGDGWETRRRRGPGHDWVLVKLAACGSLKRVEVDTQHYKGNYPDRFSLEGCRAPGAGVQELLTRARWQEILPETKLGPDARHSFSEELRRRGPFTHARLNIFPDGGVARLRLHGRLERAQ